MLSDHRYLKNEAAFLPIAQIALLHHFESEADFNVFYRSIGKPERKNQFLRASAVYYYLVKNGDWIVSAPDCNPLIDYFTNSYKTVGIFAIIESLSDESHQDFHRWMQSRPVNIFPIARSTDLELLHKEYKLTYGSIRRCISFFSRLSANRQADLCSSVEIDEKPVQSIKALAEFLYNIRSKFVHEAEFVLQMSGDMHHFGHKKLIRTKLTMPHFYSAFEEGLIAYFDEA